MTETEFNDFIEAHCRRFDGLKVRIADEAMLRDWYEALKWVNADDAEAASKRMFSEEELRPRAYHEHPPRLRSLASQIKADRLAEADRESMHFVDGERVYNCPSCCDSGFVHNVIAPTYIRAFQRGEVTLERGERQADGKTIHFAKLNPSCVRWTLACHCGKGQARNIPRRFHQDKPKQRMATYKPDYHLQTLARDDDLIAEMEAWEDRAIESHPNYNAGLAAFND